MSSSVSVDKRPGGVAVITMSQEPVNMMGMEFWKQLLAAIESCEADKKVRGVIFQSGLKKSVFTAGLDIKELHVPSTNNQRLKEYWQLLSKTLTKVYSTPMVTIAAISGACPAGGCCLALCCDYRVITTDGSMGLNEVLLGIPVPRYWAELMAETIGTRQAALVLQTGEQPASARLLQLSMVDAVLDKREELLPHAEKVVKRWLAAPDPGRVKTKEALRGSLAQRWTAGIDGEADEVWEALNQPGSIAALTQVIARLSGGAKAAPASKL
eukprot:gnl/TRDRNA2_/TRDRNA2_188292_c0_seq1.p1 gnl/TRDRNA2_/TRDRNA2_188292_c0~~gnl/TRDRNA2_/TRDRNA2_188292_c0_seq1.p1  ORF type:complete len:269 (-),score=70.59 gnl/TRDRNA2_/TRDRNA2_188292_c0_seq1:58-864(-)